MKLPFWATVFTVISALILCGLGVWQVQRLEWKTALLAQLVHEAEKDPMGFELTADNIAALKDEPIRMVIRGFAEGAYRHEDSIVLKPRMHNGEVGVHLITPFETLDNHILLVNRGWVPDGRVDISKPAGSMIITGTARRPSAPGSFTPKNDPDRGAWYWLDIDGIAAAKHLDGVLPWVLYADEDAQAVKFPIAVPAIPALPNNHLAYALFWFSMAGVLLLIYYLRFLRKDKNHD